MCLDNYIGVRGCSTTTPGSGVYINDLPGVRTLLAARIVDEEIVTGQALLQRCVERGYKLAINDLISALAVEDYILLPERALETTGKRVNRKLIAGKTFRFDVCGEGTSEYEIIYWDKLRCFASADGQINIVITQGTEVKTVTVTVLEGEGTYSVATEIDRSAKIEITADIDLDYYGGGCDCFCIGSAPFWAWVSLRADLETFACRYRHTLTNVFLYRAGIEFASEMLHSPRVNEETRAAKEKAAQMLLELKGGTDPQFASAGMKVAVQGLYPKALENAVQGLKTEIHRNKVNIFNCERSKIYYVTP